MRREKGRRAHLPEPESAASNFFPAYPNAPRFLSSISVENGFFLSKFGGLSALFDIFIWLIPNRIFFSDLIYLTA
jgi:hypothetical protein